ncbi:MAG: hypothetical protein JWM95_3508 [Gemmatimonadetes bacterium]|nr:hypothetical protein [Gemmatimonadota bacterium]
MRPKIVHDASRARHAPPREAPPEASALEASTAWLGAATPGRDLVRFGVAIFVASTFSAVQMFVIPRRLDVATYGHYRLFLMYVGYAGLLHFGLADGAFLRWAGRQPGIIAREWRQIGRWLLAVQGVVLLVALVTTLATADPFARVALIALASTTLFVNLASLASYALQGAGNFRDAGRVAMLANGLFVAFVVVVPTHTLTVVLTAYVASCAVSALYGAICVARVAHEHAGENSSPDQPVLGVLIRTGLPVLGANFAAGLSQSVDRLLVSFATPITSFALYGFAATVSVAGSSATQALSRVALSHAARRPAIERARFLGGFFDIIASAFGAGLALEPPFERLVAVSLPAYVGALPILRALVVGMPFWVATHVVLVGTLQSYGAVRRQLLLELFGVAFVVTGCSVCLGTHQPLWVVAGAATAAAITTFGVGVRIVRRAVRASEQHSARFAVVTAMQGGALLVALASTQSWMLQSLAYAALALVPTGFALRRARVQEW